MSDFLWGYEGLINGLCWFMYFCILKNIFVLFIFENYVYIWIFCY